jgi:hypothetical protein
LKRALCIIAFALQTAAVSGCSLESSKAGGLLLPAVSPAVEAAQGPVMYEPKLKGSIPSGTRLRVALLQPVSSDESRPGDSFTARLTEPVVVDGETLFERGTRVFGVVAEAGKSRSARQPAVLVLKLTQIVSADGAYVGISTKSHTALSVSAAESIDDPDGESSAGALRPVRAQTENGAAGKAGAASAREIRYGVEHPLSFTLVTTARD